MKADEYSAVADMLPGPLWTERTSRRPGAMGSTRFPGKMMARLAGRPLHEWVLRRVSRSRVLDAVWLATSQDPRNDAWWRWPPRWEWSYFAGRE